MRNLFKKMRRTLSFLRNAGAYANQESYFPESPRKSKLHIMADLFRYFWKYEQMSKFYFVYGLDTKKADMDAFMPYPLFMRLRQNKNIISTGATPYSYACLLRDKELFELIAREYSIPTPKIDGALLGGRVLYDSQRITFEDYLKEIPNGTSLFMKEKSGMKGSGAYSLDKRADKFFLNEKELSINKIGEEIPSETEYIIQKRLLQHLDMRKLYPQALNTLRVVSVIYKDDVVILGSLLRLGANGSVVDNWAHGGVAVGVNEDGTLKKWAFFKPGYGTKTDRHPNTGVLFEGYQLPYWNEVVTLVKETHKKLACIPTVGWDIAITEDGPLVIEGNDDYDGALLQACTGGKSKEFYKYYM